MSTLIGIIGNDTYTRISRRHALRNRAGVVGAAVIYNNGFNIAKGLIDYRLKTFGQVLSDIVCRDDD